MERLRSGGQPGTKMSSLCYPLAAFHSSYFIEWRMLKGPLLFPWTYIYRYYNAFFGPTLKNQGVQKKFVRFRTEVCPEIYIIFTNNLECKSCL